MGMSSMYNGLKGKRIVIELWYRFHFAGDTSASRQFLIGLPPFSPPGWRVWAGCTALGWPCVARSDGAGRGSMWRSRPGWAAQYSYTHSYIVHQHTQTWLHPTNIAARVATLTSKQFYWSKLYTTFNHTCACNNVYWRVKLSCFLL